MMSTIGRMPVIAAPTARPVNPTSEIGVSMMRCGPNSSTSPFRTLNVVPASATSSPSRTMFESRRISSAIASRIASPKPISLVASRGGVAVASSGIDVLGHPARIGIRRVDREVDRGIHLFDQLLLHRVERGAIAHAVRHQPLAMQADRIFLRHPLLLFCLRPVVRARDVADMVAVIAVGDALQECRTVATTRPLDVLRRGLVYGAHVLAVDRLVRDAERGGA